MLKIIQNITTLLLLIKWRHLKKTSFVFVDSTFSWSSLLDSNPPKALRKISLQDFTIMTVTTNLIINGLVMTHLLLGYDRIVELRYTGGPHIVRFYGRQKKPYYAKSALCGDFFMYLVNAWNGRQIFWMSNFFAIWHFENSIFCQIDKNIEYIYPIGE